MASPTDLTAQGFEPWLIDRETPTPDGPGDGGGPELSSMPRPNDDDVRRLAQHCRKARAIFIPLLGLSEWTIDFCYQRNPFPDDRKDAAMYVSAVEWAYQHAQVYISIEACYDDDYEQVRYKIVHELTHCLVEPLADHTAGYKDKHVRNAVERLVHRIATAVIDAYDATAAE